MLDVDAISQGEFVLLMDGCFWRIYEVGVNHKHWEKPTSNIFILVSKKKKRQSPMRPSWHQQWRHYVSGGNDIMYHIVPVWRIKAVYSTEEAAVHAFDMLRSVHEKHGASGEAVEDKLKLVVAMTSDRIRED